jgi:hypothetical protein
MPTNTQNKCAHPQCTCPASEGQYCSQACAESANEVKVPGGAIATILNVRVQGQHRANTSSVISPRTAGPTKLHPTARIITHVLRKRHLFAQSWIGSGLRRH